jgi:outer membrane protein OmpA-like peptidoglycan-associated protein
MTEPMARRTHLAALLAAALWLGQLAGCAPVATKPPPATTAVLLPEAGGRATSIIVTHDGQQVTASEPYVGVRDDGSGLRAYSATPAEVQARFGPALAAQPARAARFTLYFVEGKDRLTDESQSLVDRTLAEIAARPVPDVLVIGHTDAVGSHAANDALARQRAEAIRSDLIRRGVAADNVQAIARGKREPAVATADRGAEARHRRVEIVVR